DGVSRMMAALGRLHQTGTTVAMATHDVDLALAWADEALVVVDHSVVHGPIDEMLADSDIVERAHLHLPWALDLAQRMELGSLPRTMDEVVAALEAR
ncbi:MAG: cobalt ABC transporter ATP-binding protein, partial [Cutibacterium granulosum]|nr:cobalt ABC transporter ATP-binding protein [Cutibacterium granulosum]